MNVGIVTTWFERGAAYVSRQFQSTLEQKYNVYIYARGGEKPVVAGSDWDGPRVTIGKPAGQAVITAIDHDDFCCWIEDNRIELILFNEQRWWLPILWCRECGIKVGAYVDYYTEDTVKLFAIYDFLICNTKRHFSVFNWHPQCFYVPWGTDLELFKPAEKSLMSGRNLTFFHSAGMSPGRKGSDLLLEAFSRLTDTSRLVIHTQVELEDSLPTHCPLITQLKEDKRLDVIVGTVPAPGLYHLGDVYVYPSRLDGIGLSLAEAAACGLPLIATDSPPMNEFLTDDNGKLVEVDRFVSRYDGYYWPQSIANIQSLYKAMLYYVKNIDRISAFKLSARASAEEHFNWLKNSAELCHIFEKVNIQQGRSVCQSEVWVEEFERNRVGVEQPEQKKGLLGKLCSFVGRVTI